MTEKSDPSRTWGAAGAGFAGAVARWGALASAIRRQRKRWAISTTAINRLNCANSVELSSVNGAKSLRYGKRALRRAIRVFLERNLGGERGVELLRRLSFFRFS